MMTKHLLLFFIVIFIAMSAGTCLIRDPGYILIIWNHWQIETSLVFFIIGLSLVGLILAFGIKIIHALISLPSLILRGWQYLKQLRLQKREHRGLQAYFEERWPLALRQLRPVKHQHSWTIDLLAANAAQHQNELHKRDLLISKALSEAPEAKDSIVLFQAKLQIEKQQYEQAQATLEQIPLASRSQSMLWLILQTHLDIHFKQFKRGLERLISHRKLLESHHQYLELYRVCLEQEIQFALSLNKVLFAFELYKSAPLALQLNPVVLKHLMPCLEPHPKFFNYIYKQLKKHIPAPFSKDLLYVISNFPQPNLWLNFLEGYAHEHEQHAAYYYARGTLNARQKLWGLALSELQQSISLEASTPAYTELARIYMELQQTSNALHAMQHALKLEH